MVCARTSGTSKQRQRLLRILFLHSFLSIRFHMAALIPLSDNSKVPALQCRHWNNIHPSGLPQPGSSQRQLQGLVPLGDTEGVTNLPEPLWRTKPQVPTGMGLLPGGKEGESHQNVLLLHKRAEKSGHSGFLGKRSRTLSRAWSARNWTERVRLAEVIQKYLFHQLGWNQSLNY